MAFVKHTTNRTDITPMAILPYGPVKVLMISRTGEKFFNRPLTRTADS